MMPYELHPSKRLKAHFQEKPWQGADPFKALFLFVGLDANYDPDIEENLPEVFDYLNDGAAFWRQNGDGNHHPFRLEHYHGNGKKYHNKFNEIGFTAEHADMVSFVELLHLPTTGRSNLSPADLSPEHLRFLNDIFDKGAARYIFLPPKATNLMKRTGHFPWIPRQSGKNHGLTVLREKNGQTIYGMYHLSCYGWQLSVLDR